MKPNMRIAKKRGPLSVDSLRVPKDVITKCVFTYRWRRLETDVFR